MYQVETILGTTREYYASNLSSFGPGLVILRQIYNRAGLGVPRSPSAVCGKVSLTVCSCLTWKHFRLFQKVQL